MNTIDPLEIYNGALDIEPKEFRKTKAKELNIVVKDLTGWADEWYESILPENNKLILGFESFDKEFKGKLRGKLFPIIGYGGTKKSLFAQNIAFQNINQEMGNVVYSTMEMGAPEVINRLINLKLDLEDPTNPHSPIRSLEYHNNVSKRLDAKKFYIEEIAPIFKDRFFISENTGVTAEDYDKMLTMLENQGKKIDILIPDGLAGMGGVGSETENYSRHAKELKQLANKWKILIPLICHVSKGGDETTRNLKGLVRSSEKIIDECDFYATVSRFKQGDDFDKNHGAIRLINKRGSGNQIDVVFEFDRYKLTMNEIPDAKFTDYESF